MSRRKPIHVGDYSPIAAGDILDLYLDITACMEPETAISGVTMTLRDSDGAEQAGAISSVTFTASRASFRLTAPTSRGSYVLTAVFMISDGQRLTRAAGVLVD